MHTAIDEYEGLDDAERHGEIEPWGRCDDCDGALTEDEAIPTSQHAVYRCLRCASVEAGELLTAECDPQWTPTRTIGERQRAIDVMQLVVARAQRRISRDAEKPVPVKARAA